MTTRARALLLMIALSLLALPVVAQQGGPAPDDAPRDNRGRAQQRFERMRHKLLRDKIGLDEATAKQVEGIVVKYKTEQKQLFRETQQARRDLRKLFDADSNDQAAYAAAIDKLQLTARKQHELRDGQLAELRKVMTPKQQAKLLRTLDRVQRHMAQQRGVRGVRGVRGERGERGERGDAAKPPKPPKGKPPKGKPQRGKHDVGF